MQASSTWWRGVIQLLEDLDSEVVARSQPGAVDPASPLLPTAQPASVDRPRRRLSPPEAATAVEHARRQSHEAEAAYDPAAYGSSRPGPAPALYEPSQPRPSLEAGGHRRRASLLRHPDPAGSAVRASVDGSTSGPAVAPGATVHSPYRPRSAPPLLRGHWPATAAGTRPRPLGSGSGTGTTRAHRHSIDAGVLGGVGWTAGSQWLEHARFASRALPFLARRRQAPSSGGLGNGAAARAGSAGDAVDRRAHDNQALRTKATAAAARARDDAQALQIAASVHTASSISLRPLGPPRVPPGGSTPNSGGRLRRDASGDDYHSDGGGGGDAHLCPRPRTAIDAGLSASTGALESSQEAAARRHASPSSERASAWLGGGAAELNGVHGARAGVADWEAPPPPPPLPAAGHQRPQPVQQQQSGLAHSLSFKLRRKEAELGVARRRIRELEGQRRSGQSPQAGAAASPRSSPGRESPDVRAPYRPRSASARRAPEHERRWRAERARANELQRALVIARARIVELEGEVARLGKEAQVAARGRIER